MDQFEEYLEKEFIIWNPTLGIRDAVTIGEIKQEYNTIIIYLDDPYEFVGPLSLNTILEKGKIDFEACIIMTKETWRTKKETLQKESYTKQQKIHQEFQEKINSRNRKKSSSYMNRSKEKEYRKLLSLPMEGELKISQIKTAYRKTAKSTHPDTGGDHHQFVLITEAKEVLIKNLL